MSKKKNVTDFTGTTKIWREDGRISVGLSGADLPPGLRLTTGADSEVGKALTGYLRSSIVDSIYRPEGTELSLEGDVVVISCSWGQVVVAPGGSNQTPGLCAQVSGQHPIFMPSVYEVVHLALLIVRIAEEMGWSTENVEVVGWPLLRALVLLVMDSEVVRVTPTGGVNVAVQGQRRDATAFLALDTNGELWVSLHYRMVGDEPSLTDLRAAYFLCHRLASFGLTARLLVATRSGNTPEVLEHNTDADVRTYLLHYSGDWTLLVTPEGTELQADVDMGGEMAVHAEHAQLNRVRRLANGVEQVPEDTERRLLLNAQVGLSFYGTQVRLQDESTDPLERAKRLVEDAEGKSAAELVTMLVEAGLIKR